MDDFWYTENMNFFKSSFVQDIIFVLVDIAAIKWLVSLYESNNADLFLISTAATFYLYAVALHLVQQWPVFIEAHKQAREKHETLLFWVKLSHVFAFIYIPIGLFIAYVAGSGVYKGSGITIIVVIFAMAFIPILIGRAMGQEDKYSHSKLPKFPFYKYLIMIIGFVLVFAFVEAVFSRTGDYLMGELTRTITKDYNSEVVQPLWYLTLGYRILFLWFVYVPIRMWLFIPESKSLGRKVSFGVSIILILLAGFIV